MAAVTRTPRTSWINQGLRALAAGGPDAVRIEGLAKSLGVTKGGFYGYFADRNALLEEMLDAWERQSADDVVERVDREGGDARAKLRKAGALTLSTDMLPIDLAIRDWSRRDTVVAERLRRVDNRRMEYLRALFRDLGVDEDDIEARCMLAFSLLIGNHLVAADHGAGTRAEVVELATRLLETVKPESDERSSARPQKSLMRAAVRDRRNDADARPRAPMHAQNASRVSQSGRSLDR